MLLAAPIPLIDNVFDISATPVDQALDPLRLGTNCGLSPQDIRSRVQFSGSYNLNYKNNLLLRNLELGSIITLESGRPYNLITRNLMQLPVAGRNAGLLPGFTNADLRLTRHWKFKETARLQLFIEAFNLFNRVNINTIDRNFASDTFGEFKLPLRNDRRFITTPDRFRSAFALRQFQDGMHFTF